MQNKNTKVFIFSLYFFTPIILFLLLNVTPIFYNNDDWYLNQLISGELTGVPEAHLVHIGYLSGIMLSLLYRFIPIIPWYGLFLFSCGLSSLSLSAYYLSKQFEKVRDKVIFFFTVTILFISFLWIHIIQIQFTTITAFVCGTSLLLFYLSEEDEKVSSFMKQNVPGLILFFISLEIRKESCMMFLPTFFLIAIIKLMKNKKMFQPLLAYGGILLCILFFCLITEKIAYSPSQWNTFLKFSQARANIVDYSEYPDYETHKEVYDSLGITYSSYDALSSHYLILLDKNIDADFMHTMEELSKPATPGIKSILHTFMERHISSSIDRPLNLAVYLIYFIVILLIILKKRWKNFYDIAVIILGRTAIWFYILYINRPVSRITQGIYACELLLLLGIILKNELWKFQHPKKENTILKFPIIILCLLILTFSVKLGAPSIRSVVQYNESRIEFSKSYKEICNYFNEHSNNLYLLDTLSFSYFNESIWSRTPNSASNSVLLGGWIANSPWTDRILRTRGLDSYEKAAVTQDNVYFVFMHTQGLDYDYLEQYLTDKHPNLHLVVSDIVTTSNGLEFYILKAE